MAYSLKTTTRSRTYLYLLSLLMLLCIMQQATAQGLKTNARLISPPGTAIIVNGSLEIHQQTNLAGQLKLTGDFNDHFGININQGRVVFTGNGQAQTLSGNTISIFNDLEIDAQANLRIAAGKRVTVNGELTNNNPSNGLRLLASNNGTASLVHASNDITAVVERHFLTESHQFHTLAAPIAHQTIEPGFFTSGSYFYAWYEPLSVYVDYTNNSFYPTFLHANQGTDHFLPATGYLVSYPPGATGEVTKEFDGQIHQGEISFTISGLDIYSTHPFYNLAGNPYPSAIDWNAEEGWSGKEHLAGGKSKDEMPAWVWHDEYQNYGVIHPRSYAGVHNDISGYIPAMTGFWVQGAAGSHGQLLTMDNRVRVHWPVDNEKSQPGDAKLIAQNADKHSDFSQSCITQNSISQNNISENSSSQNSISENSISQNSITHGMISGGGTPQGRTRQEKNPGGGGIIRIVISLENKPWRDEILIEYHHDGDITGAGKMFSVNPMSPQLYVMHEEQNLSLLFLQDPNDKQEIQLGHVVPKNSTFFLDAFVSDDFPAELILEDKLHNRQHTLAGRQDSVSFLSGCTPANNRFVLKVLPLKTE